MDKKKRSVCGTPAVGVIGLGDAPLMPEQIVSYYQHNLQEIDGPTAWSVFRRLRDSGISSLQHFEKMPPELLSALVAAISLVHARACKVSRIHIRLGQFLYEIWGRLDEFGLYFWTQTFGDKHLAKCSLDTLRQKVRRTLQRDDCIDYILNLDFGSQNGRPHYHGILLLDRSGVRKDSKGRLHYPVLSEYGFDSLEEICIESGLRNISRYTDKIANHSVKIQTDQSLITPRNRPRPLEKYGKAVRYLEMTGEFVNAWNSSNFPLAVQTVADLASEDYEVHFSLNSSYNTDARKCYEFLERLNSYDWGVQFGKVVNS